MALWQFDEASDRIVESSAALAKRDQLATILQAIGVAMAPSIEATYESETVNLDDTLAMLDDTFTAAESVIASRDAALGELSDLGIEPASRFESSYGSATSTLAELQDNLNRIARAIAEVAAAAATHAQTRSLYEQVGLYGDDVDAVLEAAKDALANGDTDLAVAKADAAVEMIDASREVGRNRIRTAVTVLGALVLSIIVLGVWRRHRHRRSEQPGTADTL